jgi:hypothetical protein
MARYPRLADRVLGSIPLQVLAILSVACLLGSVANYTFVHARWLLLLTVAGWLLIGWRMAWQGQAGLQRGGASPRRLSALIVAALVWTAVQVGPLFAHYPPTEYRINAVAGGIAFVYLLLAFTASTPLDGFVRDRRTG